MTLDRPNSYARHDSEAAPDDTSRLAVAVDASWFGPSSRGMARHAMTLLACPFVAPILLNHPTDRSERSTPLVGKLPQPVFEQLLFQRMAKRRRADVCLSPYNTAPLQKSSIPQVTVIHDLIYMADGIRGPRSTRSSSTQTIGRLYRRWVVPRIAARATAVVTVSEMMKRALAERFELEPSKLFVVPNTADRELFRPYCVTCGSTIRILTVSGTAPHKNLSLFLNCTAKLLNEGVPVSAVIVGVSPSEGAHMLRSLNVGSHFDAFTFAKGITRAHLHSLYRGATMFVMPSLAEGFGIPLLEALAAGLPCVASDIPIFREIGGTECSYFDPRSSESLTAAIRRSLDESVGRPGDVVHRQPALAAQRYAPSAVAAAVDSLWLHLKA